ncbi:MAG: carbonic anhydrase [Polyangiaceae bacterium]|nr:carbonic anhydrase [Polyangiaceae bacterium]
MQKLVDGLHIFQSEVFPTHQELFNALSKGQKPETLFITCSDSRILPNMITQTKPGDLFILRNAGNLIPSYGPLSSHSGEAAAIEFAVVALGVSHIVVCGHTLCGAIKGLLDPPSLENMPAVKAWLAHAEGTRRVVQENYRHLEGQALLTAAIEENVLTQLENLRTHPTVRSRLARNELSLYGWVYKMETGQVFQYDHATGQFAAVITSQPAVTDVAGARPNVF